MGPDLGQRASLAYERIAGRWRAEGSRRSLQTARLRLQRR